MKRARISTEGGLTGGTGDINPQWLSFVATQSAADTTTTTTQSLPIQRLPSGGRAQVMEVLRAYMLFPTFAAIASATEAQDTYECYLSTSSFGTTATTFDNTRVFAGWIMGDRGAFTAAGTYGFTSDQVKVIDLTDGAGHGLLIATDSIFAQVVSGGTGNTNSVRIKILYRWKNVGLQEYVGLVQSQQ